MNSAEARPNRAISLCVREELEGEIDRNVSRRGREGRVQGIPTILESELDSGGNQLQG